MKQPPPGGVDLSTPSPNPPIPDAPTSTADPSGLQASSSRWLLGEPGLPGRVALSWSLAGGLTMEAALVVAAALSGGRAATSDPFAATIVFLIGVLGGFVHGALVGVVGRPDHVSRSRALVSIERSALAAVPLVVLGWGAALWISLTGTEAARGRAPLLLAVAAGWAALVVVAIWALLEGRVALRHTLTRWPLGRAGATAFALSSALLLVSFVWWRPEIWFTHVRTTALGAAILALGVTIWFGLPILALAIHLLHRRNRLAVSGDPPHEP